MARAGLPTRSQSHAGPNSWSIKQFDATLVGVDRLKAYVPDGGETVGAAIMLASAMDDELLLLASSALL